MNRRVRTARPEQRVLDKRPGHSVDLFPRPGRRAPHGEQLAAFRDGAQVDGKHDRRDRPVAKEVLRRPTFGVFHLVTDRLGGRCIEMSAACGVHRSTVLDGVIGRLIGTEKSLDVVVERVISQGSVDAKSVVSAFETRRIGWVAGHGVGSSKLTAGCGRRGKAAGDERRTGRMTEDLAAIHMKDVLHLLGKRMALDRHRQVQPPTVWRRPCVDIGNVGLGIADGRGRIEMVRCTCRALEDGEEKKHREKSVCTSPALGPCSTRAVFKRTLRRNLSSQNGHLVASPANSKVRG